MPKLKSKNDIVHMRKAGQLAAQTLHYAGSLVQPDVNTEEIDAKIHAYIVSHGAYPSPLNYKGFPKATCTSINDVICHGIPSKRDVLKLGDILNIDITVTLNGYFGDCSWTFYVGGPECVSLERKKVTQVSHDSLAHALAVVSHGKRIGDIGATIQAYAEKQGCSVVRDFVGHGIGTIFHEPDLQIPHFGVAHTGGKIVRGMTFTIEPMINAGDWRLRVDADGWTARTADGKPSAQFEHTLAVVEDGIEILTALPGDSIAVLAKELGARILWPECF